MIIKSLSRKEPSFDQLTYYMLDSEHAEFSILHNLPVGISEPEQIIQEFEENHALLPLRVNGNALYHEILSLPPGLVHLSVKKQAAALREIAEHYLERRAPLQLAVGVIHTDMPHVHIHLMISSNALLSKKRAWLETKEFAAVVRETEEYRIRQFPELGAKRYFAEPGRGPKTRVREQAAMLRSGKPSRKQKLAADVERILKQADRRADLEKGLSQFGLGLYQRGRSVGVVTEGGRRYRLSTLGLAEAYTEAMARIELAESRFAALKRGRAGLSAEIERES